MSLVPRVGGHPHVSVLTVRRLVSQESRGRRPDREALHQNQPVSRERRGHLLPAGEWSHALPISAGVRESFLLRHCLCCIVFHMYLAASPVTDVSSSDGIQFRSILSDGE